MKRFVRRLAGRLDYLLKPERRNRVCDFVRMNQAT